jgi:endogenous inhibitor of DNA gyrase (YacG/DUF329 family)
MKCPICKKDVTRKKRCFPFCCERCQLLDLYAWFNEEYGFSEPLSETISENDNDEPDPFWRN